MGADEGATTSGTDPAVGSAGDSYAMGSSEAETERLIRQSGLYAPFTRRLFERAGLGPGMIVLDVGTGAGDVALIAAEMVGAWGAVVGVDHNPEVLETGPLPRPPGRPDQRHVRRGRRRRVGAGRRLQRRGGSARD